MNAPREGAGRTALVTGASAGIGAALARVFAGQGFDLVLTARRSDRLAALKAELEAAHGIHAQIIAADLARHEAPGEILRELTARNITVDVLVNNAGYSVPGLYRDTAWADQRDLLRVLTTAPAELAHGLIGPMHARGYGRILNVASVAGLIPSTASPTFYGAAKTMMIAFSEALRSEQSGTGVHVTALCPGFTYSEFHDVNGTRARMRRLPKWLWLTAERVAEDGYRAVMRNDAMCIPGRRYKILSAVVRLLPRGVAYAAGGRAGRIRRG